MTQQRSLITDEMRKAIGVESGPVANPVESREIRRFADAIGDTNPLWNDPDKARKTRYGGMIAPPTFFRSFTVADPNVTIDHGLQRLLDGGSEWDYFEPVRVGDMIYTSKKLVNMTEREGRMGKMLLLIWQTSYKNQFGRLVATQKATHIWY